MTFGYLLFGAMFVILLIGTIIEDRRHTQMEQTIKAILARCNGNVRQAHQYCIGVSETATNPALRKEYRDLAAAIWANAVKAEAAHV